MTKGLHHNPFSSPAPFINMAKCPVIESEPTDNIGQILVRREQTTQRQGILEVLNNCSLNIVEAVISLGPRSKRNSCVHWSIPNRETPQYVVNLMAITIWKNRFNLVEETG